ncbi:isochorismatase family protein [Streptomyces krungchingensis]|uniref:isochorismatase family protein n=1 Tax=Streptomyces krungchingensis TaxID=1565034 RepID=UPI003CE85A66
MTKRSYAPGTTALLVIDLLNDFMADDGKLNGDQLTCHSIEELVLAGITSETCVEGTGRHALEAGYHVTFVNDAGGDFTRQAHRAALDVAYLAFGHENLTVAEYLSSIDA